MSEKEDNVTWITANGEHIPIPEGMTAGAAIQRHFAREDKIKPSNKPILKSISEIGMKYGDELPENVFLHGSEDKGNIDATDFNNKATAGGTLFLSKDWETANSYAGNNEEGIKAVSLNMNHVVDMANEKDRNKLGKALADSASYEGMSWKDLANGLSKLDLNERGLVEGEHGTINDLNEKGIYAIIDATKYRNVEVLNSKVLREIK